MRHKFSLDQLTVEEKIQAMEALWDDLCAKAESAVSPQWHQSVLQARETAVQIKEDEFTDWNAAKEEIIRKTK